MAARKQQTMKAVKKRGYEGVYARIYGGRVTGYVASVYDPSANNGKGGKRWLDRHERAEDARDQRIQALADRKRSTAGSNGHATVAEFAERWPVEFPRRKPGTTQTYKYGIRAFVRAFGPTRLDRLDDAAVRKWAHAAPLGSVRCARAFLNDARRAELMGENPLSHLGRSESRGRADIEVISEDDLYGLADTALDVLGPVHGLVFRAHILWAAFTCMRPAETRRLLRVNVLPTRVKVVDNESGGQHATPKNDEDRRIVLPPPARRAFETLPVNRECPYAFPSIRGTMMSKGTQHGYWDRVRCAYAAKTGDSKWRGFDQYELRHFGASFMLNELGLRPEAVAFQLGHADGQQGIDLVMRLYGHPKHKRYRDDIDAAYEAYEARQGDGVLAGHLQAV